ncbi:septum formation family protein [Dactylosporangium sp. NPDC050688]|uniref:septum formation family protein n=1 Tax=Dactylosporangium sp. NPDC050688 TaxID=3157217 RepID=UPI00340FAEF6
MRTRTAAVLVAVLALAAGCAPAPRGADRDLVDDWAMLAAAKIPEPKAGDCWTTDASQVDNVIGAPGRVVGAPCENTHTIETAHVGHFTGAQADALQPPDPGDLAEQYKVCDIETTNYLGGGWASGRTRLLVYVPASRQWVAGARFFRCDVAALRSEAGILDPRKETLRGTLAPGGPMLLGCSVRVGALASWSDLTPVACTAPHDVELAGVVMAKTGTYPADDKGMEAAYDDACWDKIRAFTGSPASVLDTADAGYGYWMMSDEDEWKSGLRAARCYVMLKKKITRSLKGNGSAAI